MANEENMDFWQAPAGVEETDREASEEMGDELTGNMKLKVPKPVFNSPTKCKVVEMKFYKVAKTEKNKNNDGEFTPFFATVTFQEVGGKEIEFRENYRGGRMYAATGDKKASTYIGPTSSLGKLKAVCVDNKISIGNSLKEWGENIKGSTAVLKAEVVQYLGKKFDKNVVVSISKQ